jgi:hypothetical protein
VRDLSELFRKYHHDCALYGHFGHALARRPPHSYPSMRQPACNQPAEARRSAAAIGNSNELSSRSRVE